MKNLIPILLVITMVVQTTYQGIIYVYYTINKEYIAANRCENKANPQLKCNGKCHLKNLIEVKTTAQTDDSSSLPTTPNLIDIKPLILFFEAIPSPNFSFLPNDLLGDKSSAPNFWYEFNYNYQNSTSSFEPPQQFV